MIKKSIFSAFILMIGMNLIAKGQIIYDPPSKKLIEFSWASPDTRDYLKDLSLYDSGPFDGISVKITAEVGGGRIFMVENLEKITEMNLVAEYKRIENIGKESTLKHNFLVLYGASQMEWFSDRDWEKVEVYLRYAANLAKKGNFRGILWDPEPYKPGRNPWKYDDQPENNIHSFYEYYNQVRKRGSQFIRVLQDEFPGLTILSLREFSDYQTGSPFSQKIIPIEDIENAKNSLKGAWWGLHLPFTIGILDAIDENVTFIDGNEEAYYYTSALEYFKLRNDIHNHMRALLPNGLHHKFKSSYYIGHAVSTDYIAGNWVGLNSFPYRLSAQGEMLTPAEKAKWFEHNLYYALIASDEYVWLYSEDLNWWTGEKVPVGFPEALERAREKVRKQAPLGFNIEDMLERARDAAERKYK